MAPRRYREQNPDVALSKIIWGEGEKSHSLRDLNTKSRAMCGPQWDHDLKKQEK